jgi:hypothetical protein
MIGYNIKKEDIIGLTYGDLMVLEFKLKKEIIIVTDDISNLNKKLSLIDMISYHNILDELNEKLKLVNDSKFELELFLLEFMGNNPHCVN